MTPADIRKLTTKMREQHQRTGAYENQATCRHGIHPYVCREGCAPLMLESADVLSALADVVEAANQSAEKHGYGPYFKNLASALARVEALSP